MVLAASQGEAEEKRKKRKVGKQQGGRGVNDEKEQAADPGAEESSPEARRRSSRGPGDIIKPTDLCKCCADIIESLIGAMFVEAALRHSDAPCSDALASSTAADGGSAFDGGAVKSSDLKLEDPRQRDAALEEVAEAVLRSILPIHELQEMFLSQTTRAPRTRSTDKQLQQTRGAV